jgi:polyketide biosynthesis enoyl-CoA hydratase PksI
MNHAVELSEPAPGVVQVTMQDRLSRNSFSPALMEGIVDAFEKIRNNTGYKVAIITGYENYFCCGGTKEELVSIYEGRMNFNDLGFFTLPLECEVPVIAAMQGHGIGGGFVFGMYADFCILGRESIYTANFMKYGFTPGMGATLMVPLRLGDMLGNEMLFSAETYRGGELKERGASLKVVPKQDVLQEAVKLAVSLADKPRSSLITLKEHLTAGIKARLPEIIRRELDMHRITFHQQEVADRIENFFERN